jgi:glutaredoxin 2
VRYVDEHFGGPMVLKEASGREDLKLWFQQILQYLQRLLYPRKVAAPFAEFALRSSREYFQKKKEKQVGPFRDLVAKSPELIAAVEALLVELDGLLASEHAVNADGVSYDDITVFGSIRCLTIVKDLKWPPKVRVRRLLFPGRRHSAAHGDG